MQVDITSNIDQVLAHLEQHQRKGEQLSPLFDSIANLLLNTTEESFETETSPIDGSPWQPLAASTLAKKKGKPLHEKGKMQGSLVAMRTQQYINLVQTTGELLHGRLCHLMKMAILLMK